MCESCSHCDCWCDRCSPYTPEPPKQGPYMESGDFIFKKSMLQQIYEPMIRQQLEAHVRMHKILSQEDQ